MISDNPSDSLGIDDYSFYIRCIAVKDDYHKKRLDMLADTPLELKYLEIFAETFIISAGHNQLFQENIFINAPARRNAIAMITSASFTGPYAENPVWYQQFDRR